MVKAVDCFVYQSCEHAGWATSRAADYCARLRVAALAGLPLESGDPGGRGYPIGYDCAPWGIDDLTESAAVAHRGALGERAFPAAAERGAYCGQPWLAGVSAAALREAARDPGLAPPGQL